MNDANSPSGGPRVSPETRILAHRRREERPPQRHRGRGDDPEFGPGCDVGFTLCGLRVSVVRNPRALTASRAKQSQFAESQMSANYCSKNRLRRKTWIVPPRKQSQFAGALLRQTKPICATGRGGPGAGRAKQSQSAGAQTKVNAFQENGYGNIGDFPVMQNKPKQSQFPGVGMPGALQARDCVFGEPPAPGFASPAMARGLLREKPGRRGAGARWLGLAIWEGTQVDSSKKGKGYL